MGLPTNELRSSAVTTYQTHKKVNQRHTHGFPSQIGAQEGIDKVSRVPRPIVNLGGRHGKRKLEGLYDVDQQPLPNHCHSWGKSRNN